MATNKQNWGFKIPSNYVNKYRWGAPGKMSGNYRWLTIKGKKMRIDENQLENIIFEEVKNELNEVDWAALQRRAKRTAQKAGKRVKSALGIDDKPKIKSKPDVGLMQKLMGGHPELGKELINLMSRGGRIKKWNDGKLGRGTQKAVDTLRAHYKEKGVEIPRGVVQVTDFLAGEEAGARENPAAMQAAKDQKLAGYVAKLVKAPVAMQIKQLANWVEYEKDGTARPGTVDKIKQIAAVEGETVLASLVDKVKADPEKALAMADPGAEEKPVAAAGPEGAAAADDKELKDAYKAVQQNPSDENMKRYQAAYQKAQAQKKGGALQEMVRQALKEKLISERILKSGSRGEPVKQLQQKLIDLGHMTMADVGGGKDFGIYGPRTVRAVRAYQRKNKLKPDGVAGPNTLGKLGLAAGGAVGMPGGVTPVGAPGKVTPTGAQPETPGMAPARLKRQAEKLKGLLSGWVDANDMKQVVGILNFFDQRGQLGNISNAYRSLTGSGLQKDIRAVSGVHGLKNQALAILGGKAAEKDITTKAGEKAKGAYRAVTDKIKSFLSGLFGGSGSQQVKKLSRAAKRNSYLLYDGDNLNWVSGGKVQAKWPATSGKVWFLPAGERDQAAKSFGPIPESKYKTGGIQSMKRNVGDPSLTMQAEYLIREMISTYLPDSGVKPAPHGWGEKKGDAGTFAKIAWGNYRIRIIGSALGRGGFYIHGGSLRGSSGCIDLGDGMDEFAKFWTVNTVSRRRGPKLVVNYRGKEEAPDTSADRVARAKKKNIKRSA